MGTNDPKAFASFPQGKEPTLAPKQPLRPHYDGFDERFDPDEPPPEPPDTLDLFENQRYMSKLIEWGLEASKRERRRPHLVERDDDEEGRS